MGDEPKLDREYIRRRRKEDLAFFMVRFMRTFIGFNDLWEYFKKVKEAGGGFQGSGIFHQVRDLEENLIFDIKEKAHFLFRSRDGEENDCNHAEADFVALGEILHSDRDPAEKKSQAARILRNLRRSLICKSIDSYVGTGFHLFMILRESVYQLEHYGPLFHQEHGLITEAESFARQMGYTTGEEELIDLSHIRDIDSQSQFAIQETQNLAERAFERCCALFQKTAEMVRLHIEDSEVNEILVLNLLREKWLVERIYGPGELDRIFTRMLRHLDLPASGGLERAFEYARRNCGNVEGLSGLSS